MSYAYGLLTMYDMTAKIGTEYTPGSGGAAGTWDYAVLGDGIENLTEALNETIQQYFFLGDGGFGKNHVTAMAPAYTFTGKRVFGDAAQDYIFSKKFSLNSDRRSSFQLQWGDGTNTYTLTCDCTICNVQELSGASTEDCSISFEIRLDGEPTLTTT